VHVETAAPRRPCLSCRILHCLCSAVSALPGQMPLWLHLVGDVLRATPDQAPLAALWLPLTVEVAAELPTEPTYQDVKVLIMLQLPC